MTDKHHRFRINRTTDPANTLIIDRRSGRAVAAAETYGWAMYLVKAMNTYDANRITTTVMELAR